MGCRDIHRNLDKVSIWLSICSNKYSLSLLLFARNISFRFSKVAMKCRYILFEILPNLIKNLHLFFLGKTHTTKIEAVFSECGRGLIPVIWLCSIVIIEEDSWYSRLYVIKQIFSEKRKVLGHSKHTLISDHFLRWIKRYCFVCGYFFLKNHNDSFFHVAQAQRDRLNVVEPHRCNLLCEILCQ